VRSFIGAVNFDKSYFPNSSTVLAPLTDLMGKRCGNVVQWTDDHQQAFIKAKEMPSSGPVLRIPGLNKQFVLQTDASGVGIGAALLQEHEG
jgi:hypothetical protein